ncbi:hypothetical protein [Haliangium sp.]|uniref:hypothetical protein n=1 Tax=Haliangium sp. TaxID=2663208 RepID=UPI003D141292
MAKELDIRDTIRFPRDLAFEVIREKLSELDAYLPNIDEIKVEQRSVRDDGCIEFVNLWRASRKEIPAVIRPFIKPELLQWYDYATWDCAAYVCHWRTEMAFLDGAITSTGTNYYRSLDDGTMEVHLTGTIEVAADKIPGVPKLMSKKVAGAVESGVLKMTEPNLRAINRGFEKYIEANHNPRHPRPGTPIPMAS